MAHTEKIKERIERGETLGIAASANPQAVQYAMTKIKGKYLEFSGKADSFAMHEWEQEQRDTFFRMFVAHYLTYETKVAEVGVSGKTR